MTLGPKASLLYPGDRKLAAICTEVPLTSQHSTVSTPTHLQTGELVQGQGRFSTLTHLWVKEAGIMGQRGRGRQLTYPKYLLHQNASKGRIVT